MQKREKFAIFTGATLILFPLLVYPARGLIQANWGQNLNTAIGSLTFGALLLQVFFNREQSRTAARQADIAEKQRELMERQAEISGRQVKIIEESERPLVLVQTFRWQIEGWSHQAEKNVFPAIVISLANFGAGVALADFCQIGMFIGVKPPEKHELFGEFRMAVMHDENGNVRRHFYENVYLIRRGLMPHLDHWEIRLKDIKLTPAQVDELSTGHQKAWVDAEVFYTDIRGAKRTTCFRYLYDRQADMFIPDHSLPNFNRHA